MGFADGFPFLRESLRSPRDVAAVAPSGKAPAALIARGVLEEGLILIEYSKVFADKLRTRFPNATVLCMDVGQLAQLKSRPYGAVVCGLGLLNMPQGKVHGIMRDVFARLGEQGILQLFTYGARCSVSDRILDELGLQVKPIGRTWLNIPPALVYRITRRPASAAECTVTS